MILRVTVDGILEAGGERCRCALGKGGVVTSKREGDGATPAGSFPLRFLFYRADRVSPPETGLPARALAPQDGWCDAPEDPAYNRLVALPYRARTETLCREDALYDYIVTIGYNDDPVVPGQGSAIFLHVAKADYAPTEGCVALAADDLRRLLPHLSPQSRIVIEPAPRRSPSRP
jgi:L,D-peptidoglycan transpeptidase YkuD (ErfK/YbiS/YcfS/YnhG family)